MTYRKAALLTVVLLLGVSASWAATNEVAITAISSDTNGVIVLSVTGPPEQHFVTECSTNLVYWEPLHWGRDDQDNVYVLIDRTGADGQQAGSDDEGAIRKQKYYRIASLPYNWTPSAEP